MGLAAQKSAMKYFIATLFLACCWAFSLPVFADSLDEELEQAVASYDAEQVRELMRAGADPLVEIEGKRWTAMEHAMREGVSLVVVAMVEEGADVNYQDGNGMTPLILAASEPADIDMVRLFLQKGADVDAVDLSGRTALMLAVQADRSELVRLLLDYGSNPAAVDDADISCLQIARSRGADDIVQLLIDAGAQ